MDARLGIFRPRRHRLRPPESGYIPEDGSAFVFGVVRHNR